MTTTTTTNTVNIGTKDNNSDRILILKVNNFPLGRTTSSSAMYSQCLLGGSIDMYRCAGLLQYCHSRLDENGNTEEGQHTGTYQ